MAVDTDQAYLDRYRALYAQSVREYCAKDAAERDEELELMERLGIDSYLEYKKVEVPEWAANAPSPEQFYWLPQGDEPSCSMPPEGMEASDEWTTWYEIYRNDCYGGDVTFSIVRADWVENARNGYLPTGILCDLPFYAVEEDTSYRLLEHILARRFDRDLPVNLAREVCYWEHAGFDHYEDNYFLIGEFEKILEEFDALAEELEVHAPDGYVDAELKADFYRRFTACMREMIAAFRASRGELEKEFPYVVCVKGP